MKTHIAVLGSLVLLSACGPSDRLALVSLAFDRDGAGTDRVVASAIAVDADGQPAWMATHAAGASAIAAPDDPVPLNVCVRSDGPVRHSTLTAFRALEMGAVTAHGPNGEALGVPTTELATGEGVAYSAVFGPEELPLQEGAQYELRASGSADVPSIAVGIKAPPELKVEALGFTAPGPGFLAIMRAGNLRVTWSPEAPDADFFILLQTDSVSVICRAADTGEFTVPRSWLEVLPTGHGTLMIERIYAAPFESAAAGDGRSFPGIVRLALRRSYTVDFQ